jgi:hypothetical protein
MLSNATFSAMADKSIAENHIIVKLSDGSTDYYFSDVNMDFGAIKVWDRLDARRFTYKAGQDPIEKTWSVSSIKITLHNNPYRVDSSNNTLRPSDDLTGLFAQEAKVYLCAGSGDYIDSFPSDCLLIFDGYIAPSYKYDNRKMEISLIDKSKLRNKKLPQNTVGDIYSSAPIEVFNKKIPIVYGTFTTNADDDDTCDYTGAGLAIMYATENKNAPKMVVADHVVNAFTSPQFLHDEDIPDPLMIQTPTTNDNDSGRGTVTASLRAYAFLYPDVANHEQLTAVGPYDPTKNATSWSNPDNYENAFDRDLTTYAEPYDTYDDNVDIYSDSHFWLPYLGWLEDRMKDSPDEAVVQGKITQPGSASGTVFLWLMSSNTGQVFGSGAPPADSINADGTYESSGNIKPTIWTYWDDMPHIILVHVNDEGSSNDDGTPDNFVMLNIYEVRLRIRFRPTNPRIGFSQLTGREHGSWVTESGRSNGFASGSGIVRGAMIIESILRDELGFVTSEIDTASFDDAMNGSTSMRINIHDDNQGMAWDIIKQLCEQNTYNFFYSGAGQAKLIPLNDSSPTTNKTFYYDQIVADRKGEAIISVKRRSIKATRGKIKSRHLREYGPDFYADFDEIANTTQESALSYSPSPVEYPIELSWPNLEGSSVSHVANFYFRKRDGTGSDSNGLWAYEWIEIEFEIAGFVAAAVEPGDWIELDDTSIDTHLLCAGASWSGKQFLVEEITIQAFKTKIKAIELL